MRPGARHAGAAQTLARFGLGAGRIALLLPLTIQSGRDGRINLRTAPPDLRPALTALPPSELSSAQTRQVRIVITRTAPAT